MKVTPCFTKAKEFSTRWIVVETVRLVDVDRLLANFPNSSSAMAIELETGDGESEVGVRFGRFDENAKMECPPPSQLELVVQPSQLE